MGLSGAIGGHPLGRGSPAEGPRLVDGSRVAIIGGGPAGSFFALFLLQMAGRVGRRIAVDIYESKEFSCAGPRGCNMCGGIISESLIQHLAAEGINLPAQVIQRRIDSYMLHMDVGSVRIAAPMEESRIAAVHRGAGPRTFESANPTSFDGYLLERAADAGAEVVPRKVAGVGWRDERPLLRTVDGQEESYDLVAPAVGVNAAAIKSMQVPGLAWTPPASTRAYVCEFPLGRSVVDRYLGHSMHLFLLDLPRLDFAAIIPKSNYVTVCLLGRDIDKDVTQAFFAAPEVQLCMPPHWTPPVDHCRCSPRLSIGPSGPPYADRLVFVGECATSRLYKDGIGAAYKTAKAAAVTAMFEGVGAVHFRRHYEPVCRALDADNRIGKVVYAMTRQIQCRGFARRGLWRLVSKEQRSRSARRDMSGVLWDVFTGSAPYRSVLKRMASPGMAARLGWELMARRRSDEVPSSARRMKMASGTTGLLGRKYEDGEVIYRQGDRGDCMYVIQGGSVEVTRRQGDKEYCMAELADGDFFGEMGLFSEEVRSATVRAVGEAWVYTLEKDSLLRRVHEDPSLAFRIIEKMSRRIHHLESALVREAEGATAG